MDKKIKSIAIKKDYKFINWELEKTPLTELIEGKPDAFLIEYEKETPKYPNGAEILEPETGTRYFYKNEDLNDVDNREWIGEVNDRLLLRKQEVFLDKDKCRYSIVLKIRHLKIVQKVYQINAENDWVADWSDEKQKKYYCYFNSSFDRVEFSYVVTFQDGGKSYYSKQAQEYIDTLSIEDQKAFLLIY